MQQVLALDIGGTKCEVARVDVDGQLLERRRVSTIGASDGDELFERIAQLVRELIADPVPFVACGVGCGGPMTKGGEAVSPLNIGVWRDFPLRSGLAELTGLPTFVDNDAKAVALAEGWKGRAHGVENFIGMVVSTGVGGGIVLDGRLLDGGQGNAGHIGHVVVEPNGTELPGHVQGVLEAEASGTALAFRTNDDPSNADLDERRRAAVMVGRAVGSVANLLDLRLAVVAGSVALGFGDQFFSDAQSELDRVAALDHSTGAIIVPAALGSDAPLVGAAAVGLRGLGWDIGIR